MLAVWMTVLGLGVSLSHSHAAGGIPHLHGYGLNRSTSFTTPAGRSEGPPEPHRHFVLFGIEFPGDSCTDPPVVDSGVTQVDSAIGSDCDLPEYQAADIVLDCVPAVVFVGSVTPPRFSSAPPLSSAPLSAFARRDLAGVLRC